MSSIPTHHVKPLNFYHLYISAFSFVTIFRIQFLPYIYQFLVLSKYISNQTAFFLITCRLSLNLRLNHLTRCHLQGTQGEGRSSQQVRTESEDRLCCQNQSEIKNNSIFVSNERTKWEQIFSSQMELAMLLAYAYKKYAQIL